jgi:restriction endonuclease S subunit
MEAAAVWCISQSVNERVEPSQAGDETYVGLEHLDPQDLHIRRWGKGSDVIGTKLRFRKGDLIFGRRRAYQRKLAVAEFDGICSAHAMVVRAKPDVVLPEFLPFLMMSERFMNRAVEISVGSLSPTINWSTLKLEEFAIPPLDQQRRIAEILWTVDDHKLALEAAHFDFRKAYDAFANEYVAAASYPLTKLGDLSRSKKLDIQTGPFGTVLQASSYAKEGTPIVNPVNMVQHRLFVQEGPYLDSKECERLNRYRMKAGDILIGRKGDVGRAVLVVPEYEGFIVGSDLIRLRLLNADIQPDYLYFFLLAP